MSNLDNKQDNIVETENKIDKSKFEFVQMDEKLFDTKFETKSVTYMQDALKRFAKNKASITAFVILMLIVLLGIFAPVASSLETEDQNVFGILLPPRWPVVSNWGWMDGVTTRYGVPINELERTPIHEDPWEANYRFRYGTWELIEYITRYDANGNPIVTLPDGTLIAPDQPERTDVWADIYVNEYALAFGIRTLRNLSSADFAALPEDSILHYTYIESTILGIPTRQYTVLVIYARVMGYDSWQDIYFLFGTDGVGRDLWVRVWSGVRVSLLLGVLVAIISLSIGIVWGSISGYYGGRVDLVMERIVEIITGVPTIVVFTIITIHLGRNFGAILMALFLTSWIGTASLTRMQFYRYKGHEYVLAARTLGAKDVRIMTKHILPNAIGPLVTSAVLIIPGTIFFEATMAFLGLGLADGVSIGILLNAGQGLGIVRFPWITMFPAIVVSLLMISFNMFGNGLRDALNPSLRGME